MYQRAETLADAVWKIVGDRSPEVRRTVGEQLIRAAGSIGANIAEAAGRYHPGEARQFLFYARGSLRETVYWLRRVRARHLAPDDTVDGLLQHLDQLALEINQAVKHQRSRSARINEDAARYLFSDPFPDHSPSSTDGNPNADA